MKKYLADILISSLLAIVTVLAVAVLSSGCATAPAGHQPPAVFPVQVYRP
jgi:hypothetical protein